MDNNKRLRNFDGSLMKRADFINVRDQMLKTGMPANIPNFGFECTEVAKHKNEDKQTISCFT